jgi:hypothetical protein
MRDSESAISQPFPCCAYRTDLLIAAANSDTAPNIAMSLAAPSAAELQQLCTVLLHTFDPDGHKRHAAEQQLVALEAVPGGHALLLQICTLEAAPFPVRQAASLRLKNIYRVSALESKMCCSWKLLSNTSFRWLAPSAPSCSHFFHLFLSLALCL